MHHAVGRAAVQLCSSSVHWERKQTTRYETYDQTESRLSGAIASVSLCQLNFRLCPLDFFFKHWCRQIVCSLRVLCVLFVFFFCEWREKEKIVSVFALCGKVAFVYSQRTYDNWGYTIIIPTQNISNTCDVDNSMVMSGKVPANVCLYNRFDIAPPKIIFV